MLKLSRPGAMSNNYKEQNDIAISPEITKVVQKLKQRSLYMVSYSSDPKRFRKKINTQRLTLCIKLFYMASIHIELVTTFQVLRCPCSSQCNGKYP